MFFSSDPRPCVIATRDQTAALDQAYRMARWDAQHRDDSKASTRIYVVEVSPDGWGACRRYWVDQLPPAGDELAEVWEVHADGLKPHWRSVTVVDTNREREMQENDYIIAEHLNLNK